MARRLPVGVVGVIAPFNAPIILAIRAVAPALALGNAVVLKPDPRTPVCGGVVFARIFEEAGTPPGLFHVLPGGADVGAAVVDDPVIRVIAFTGSTRGREDDRRAGGGALKRVHLELGRQLRADRAGRRRPGEGGVGRGVRLVHPPGADLHGHQPAPGRRLDRGGVRAALAEHADRMPVGDPAGGDVGMGPIIDAAQRDRVHGIVTASVAPAPRCAPAAPTRGCSTGPRCSPTSP